MAHHDAILHTAVLACASRGVHLSSKFTGSRRPLATKVWDRVRELLVASAPETSLHTTEDLTETTSPEGA